MKFYSRHQNITLPDGPTQLTLVEGYDDIFEGEAPEEFIENLEGALSGFRHLDALTTTVEDFEGDLEDEAGSEEASKETTPDAPKKNRGGRPPKKVVVEESN